MRELCDAAVEAALRLGASYADARAVVKRAQSVATKNGRVESVNDLETEASASACSWTAPGASPAIAG